MKNEYINKIREACIKANPDILKLVAGCRFWVWAGDRKGKLDCFMINDTHYALSKYITKNQYVWEISEKEIIDSGGEIIGRPIRLSDALLVVYKSNIESHYDVVGICEGIIDAWNLQDDNLEAISEEKLKRISNLLS